jgi:hypothetical protein
MLASLFSSATLLEDGSLLPPWTNWASAVLSQRPGRALRHKDSNDCLFLEESQFDEMLDALKENKNVVLQGAFGGPYRLWNEPCRDNAAQVLILLMAEGKGTLAR